MKTVIYLVRHGDVQNPDQIMYERMDGFPLSILGEQQADALGKFLSTKSIAALYTSPLERTRQTAKFISSYHPSLSMVLDERLIEVATPARGRKFEELERDRWNFYRKEHIAAGGERIGDIWKRMSLFFKDALVKHQSQTIVAVSHGDPIMISRAKHMGKRLSLSTIRNDVYVQTAHGYEIIFDGLSAVEVNTLDF